MLPVFGFWLVHVLQERRVQSANHIQKILAKNIVVDTHERGVCEDFRHRNRLWTALVFLALDRQHDVRFPIKLGLWKKGRNIIQPFYRLSTCRNLS